MPRYNDVPWNAAMQNHRHHRRKVSRYLRTRRTKTPSAPSSSNDCYQKICFNPQEFYTIRQISSTGFYRAHFGPDFDWAGRRPAPTDGIMPEVEMVEGEAISQEEANAPGWQTALSKNKRSPRQQEGASTQSVGTAGRCTATAQGVIRRLAAASRLPRLPRSHIRVIVRPKGGLDLKKVSLIRLAQALATAANLSPEDTKEDIVCPNLTQNILVVSTPESKNAGAYAALCLIRLGSTDYQVSAYTAASDDTCKGIIRGVDVDIDAQQLAAMIVNQRNPKAMEVHRIKDTTTVVILFKVCRGCAVNDPAEDHQCQPKCALCGGAHLTADKSCRHRFQVPFVVRQRRRRRKRAKKHLRAQEGPTSRDSSVAPPSRLRSPSPAFGKRRSRSRGRSGSRGRPRSKGRSLSKLRFQEAPTTWAERAKPRPAQQPAQVTHAALPEQKEDPRIAFLLQENASLKAQLQQMRVEFEALKNSAQAPVRPSSAEPRPAKRRIGTEGEVAAASDSAVLGAIRDLQKSLARQAECFDLVACKVAMIESRLGLGENSFVPVTPVSLVFPGVPRYANGSGPRN
ncbi:hypothetical protein HPB52_021404 [Rhipicephalus sanguineus]|uniref:Uncharacterized protein n=1 Tax=Rhipicephalus sanguineus TaxID=34632 RepID=A0A9D4SSW2_RHISA|nr:hypothetical protein HPB52_021404 [Rhipicephalus sanguineus]